MSRWPFIAAAIVVGCAVALLGKLLSIVDEPWATHVGRFDA